MKRQLLKAFRLCCVFLLLPFVSLAQKATVSGRITDEQDKPLPGVNITLKGASAGQVSDSRGSYTITVNNAGSDVLIFSMIGYATREIAASGGPEINIRLTPDNRQLNEIVVVGYGTQRRKDITGSIASVKGDDFKNQPITNPTEALQGRIAGIDVVKNSGAPDATPSIIIRGLTSLSQPAPLYIVDGVRTPDGNNLNVQDIATIDVLKDASAAAIYGSAAAGGVIVITTKKGGGTTPSINFNARYGITKPRVVKLLDRDGFIRLQNLIRPQFFTGAARIDTLANTDWVKTLYDNATEQNYNLSINGSTPSVNYLVSGFYNKQEGVYIRNFSNIAGARVNSDYNLGKYIKIGEQIAVSQRETAPPIGVEAQLHNAPFRTLPIVPLYNKDGSYGTIPGGYNGFTFGGPNPLSTANAASVQNFKNNFQGNVYANIQLPFHLNFRTTFGYTYYHETQDYFQDVFTGAGAIGNNSLNKLSIDSRQLLSNYVLTYDQTFGKHNLNAVAGFEQISSKYFNTNVTATSIGLPGYSFIPTTATGYVVNGKTDNNGLIKSFFGRLNYNFNSKYYLSGSIRQDANFTVFGPNKQKGVFPAASAGWTISEEPFLKSALPIINTLKLRGSYGELGNSNISPYSFLALYSRFSSFGQGSAGGQNFAPGTPLIIGNSYGAIPNPDLHWETVRETNIGLDGELWNNKIYFTAEWYNKTTKDLLYALPVSLSSGITSPYLTNIGSVNSKGVDILLGYRDKAGEFGFDVSVTAGFNKNKVLSLSGITTDALYDGYNFYNNGDTGFNIMPNQRITISQAGLPFGSFFGYKVLGIFKTDAEAAGQKVNGNVAHAGDLIYQNIDGNTEINAADRQVIGNPNPKMVYGISLRFNYKGFDAALLFNGVAGVDLFNGKKAYEMFPFSDGNTSPKIFNASYLGQNQLTDQPRIGIQNGNTFTLDPNSNYSSVNSYFVEKGDYLKLKNLQIGYTFSSNMLNRVKVKSARIFVMGNNLFTITKYSGLDPELGSAFSQAGYSGPTTRGIDAVSQYPQTRIYSLGLDLNF
jgi:TonB-linked SusC/RagA family outer membrane protein